MAAQLSGAGEDGDETIAAINVTPLVDIVLVLLVVFMVTARLITQSSLPMDLPKAATGGAEQEIWSISIDRGGGIVLNGDAVTGPTLRDRARAALRERPDLRAVIAASTHAEHGAVVRVLDELRQAGLSRVGFGVSPEDAR